MKLVVDTNVLLTYFWKTSVFRILLARGVVTCMAPEFALEEINPLTVLIRRKSGCTERSFQQMKEELAVFVDFVPLETYQASLKRAERICPDVKDVDFFSLAMSEPVPLWSNDAQLKRQKTVRVLSTQDLLASKEFLRAFGSH